MHVPSLKEAFHGKEFDPEGASAANPGTVDEESTLASGEDRDRVDGQIEGVFGDMLGQEAGEYGAAEAAAAYLAEDAEKARRELLDEE